MWYLDREHTKVRFSCMQFIRITVNGEFTDFDADIALDPHDPERSHVSATIFTASLTTGLGMRDADLKSAHFLDAQRFPTITFVSTRVAKVGPDSFWISGRLTIRGVTREVTLRGRFNAPLADLASAPSVHFELGAEVDREDYGMEWPPTEIGGVIVGQTVTISISAEVRAVADHDAQSGTALAAPRPSVAATGAPVIPFNAAQGDPRI